MKLIQLNSGEGKGVPYGNFISKKQSASKVKGSSTLLAGANKTTDQREQRHTILFTSNTHYNFTKALPTQYRDTPIYHAG